MFAKLGTKISWEAVRRIEINALVKAGLDPKSAKAVVDAAISQLRKLGVELYGYIP